MQVVEIASKVAHSRNDEKVNDERVQDCFESGRSRDEVEVLWEIWPVFNWLTSAEWVDRDMPGSKLKTT